MLVRSIVFSLGTLGLVIGAITTMPHPERGPQITVEAAPPRATKPASEDGAYAREVAALASTTKQNQDLIHRLPHHPCPAEYGTAPGRFSKNGESWEGCVKPGSWTYNTGGIGGTLDFLLPQESLGFVGVIIPPKQAAPEVQADGPSHHI